MTYNKTDSRPVMHVNVAGTVKDYALVSQKEFGDYKTSAANTLFAPRSLGQSTAVFLMDTSTITTDTALTAGVSLSAQDQWCMTYNKTDSRPVMHVNVAGTVKDFPLASAGKQAVQTLDATVTTESALPVGVSLPTTAGSMCLTFNMSTTQASTVTHADAAVEYPVMHVYNATKATVQHFPLAKPFRDVNFPSTAVATIPATQLWANRFNMIESTTTTAYTITMPIFPAGAEPPLSTA